MDGSTLEGNAWLSAIIQGSDDAIISKDLNGIIKSWNPGAERLFGFEEKEAIGKPMTIVFPKERIPEELMILTIIGSGKQISRFETERQHKDGHIILVSINLSPIYDHGEIIGVSKIAHDITARRRLENKLKESERFTKLISDNVPALIAYWDKNFVCLFSNKPHVKLFGICAEQIVGMKMPDLLGKELFSLCESHFAKAIKGCRQTFELPILAHDRSLHHTLVEYVPDMDQHEQIKGIFVLITDITEQKHIEIKLKKMNDKLNHLSRTDALTGIPNRRCFDDRLQTEWKRAIRYKSCIGLLLIDIDYFKKYNDHYGHAQGDDCLQKVASAMILVVREASDMIARYGGEEFVCLLSKADDEGLRILAQRLIEAVRNAQIPHAESEVSSFVTISIGGALLAPEHKKHSPIQIIKAADQNLYLAKRGGRNRSITSWVDID